MVLENLGSLITIQGTDTCLGYLMDFGAPHGVHDATYGKVEVSPEDAKAHNKALDKALIDGLTEGCEIGQGTVLYIADTKLAVVTTFVGAVVGTAVLCTGTKRTYMFALSSKTGMRMFRGTMHGRDAQSAFFKRVK